MLDVKRVAAARRTWPRRATGIVGRRSPARERIMAGR